MMWTSTKALRLPDAVIGPNHDFAASVIEGLSRPRKSLPCRFFYDARGSALFEACLYGCLTTHYPLSLLQNYRRNRLKMGNVDRA